MIEKISSLAVKLMEEELDGKALKVFHELTDKAVASDHANRKVVQQQVVFDCSKGAYFHAYRNGVSHNRFFWLSSSLK